MRGRESKRVWDWRRKESRKEGGAVGSLRISPVCSGHQLLQYKSTPPLIKETSLCDRKPQPIKMQSRGALFQWISTKSQGTLKRGQRDCKTQRIKEFAVRWCLSAMPEATAIQSHQHGCSNMSSARMVPLDIPGWTGESP